MFSTLAFALLVSCAQQKDVAALEAKVTALEEKLAALEKKAPAGPASSAEEEAANAIMKEATEAMKGNDYATAKAKLQELTAKHSATKAGKAADRMYKEVGLIGTDAKPIEVDKWFQGKADYADAPVTMMVFWEVWCPHCKKEMPELAVKEEGLKAKGVQVIGITKVTKSSTDEKVEEFIKENNIKYPMAKEKDASLSEGFNVSGIPAAALVKGGKVIWRGHPGRLDDATLDKLIAG